MMSFTSLPFIPFLLTALLIFFLSPAPFRKYILLLAGLVFIGWNSCLSLVVLSGSICMNQLMGRWIEKSGHKTIYYFGLLANLLLLFGFRATANNFGNAFYQSEQLITLLGISFYTLQSIAYLTAIYHGQITAKKQLLNLACYLSFFPKLIAGPIEEPENFLTQLKKPSTLNTKEFAFAFQRILFGLIKKMVLADRIAPMAAAIFETGTNEAGITTLTALYLFTFQLYFDFSGYTDMAIGIAHLFGIRLSENFHLPFHARSVTDFWRRWHMSLIQWITVHLYYPIVYHLRTYQKGGVLIGILVIFLISGIWHGWGWTFMIWSMLHALFMALEWGIKNKTTTKKSNRGILSSTLGLLYTFHAVVLANTFFRAPSAEKAVKLIHNVFSQSWLPKDYHAGFVLPLTGGGYDEYEFYLISSLLLCGGFLFLEKSITKKLSKKPHFFWMMLMLILLFIFGVYDQSVDFIYKQF